MEYDFLNVLRSTFEAMIQQKSGVLVGRLNEIAKTGFSEEVEVVYFERSEDYHTVYCYQVSREGQQLGLKCVMNQIVAPSDIDPFAFNATNSAGFIAAVNDFHEDIARDFEVWFKKCFEESTLENVDVYYLLGAEGSIRAIDMVSGVVCVHDEDWSFKSLEK